jgi:Flp pilus assembly protein TadG
MTLRRRTRNILGRRRQGQALVEVALVLPIFLLVLVALFDLGRGVFAYNTLTNASREGVRLAIVNQDQASIIARAKGATAIVELDDPSVNVTYYQMNDDGTKGGNCTPAAVGCVAEVSFQATYRPITPLISDMLFRNGVTFTANSTLVVEYSCPNSDFTASQCPKQP